MGFWLWQHRWAAWIVGGVLIATIGITAVFWAATVFVAIWTGDGIPAAFALICREHGVPPWLQSMCAE